MVLIIAGDLQLLHGELNIIDSDGIDSRIATAQFIVH